MQPFPEVRSVCKKKIYLHILIHILHILTYIHTKSVSPSLDSQTRQSTNWHGSQDISKFKEMSLQATQPRLHISNQNNQLKGFSILAQQES